MYKFFKFFVFELLSFKIVLFVLTFVTNFYFVVLITFALKYKKVYYQIVT